MDVAADRTRPVAGGSPAVLQGYRPEHAPSTPRDAMARKRKSESEHRGAKRPRGR